MWRQNAFPGNHDSDQSISDEEELNGDFGPSCFSLNTNAEKVELLLLQSRLEILRGKDDNHSSFFDEDEVEMPDFLGEIEGGIILSRGKESTYHPEQEIISDSENDYAFSEHAISPSATKLQKGSSLNTFRSEIKDVACTWSSISKEAEELIRLNQNSFSSTSNLYQANKSCKGVRGKVKPKFSLLSKLHKDGLPLRSTFVDENIMPSSIHGGPEHPESTEGGTIDNSNLDFVEDFHGEDDEQLKYLSAEVEAFGNGLNKHSIAELLDGLQDSNVVPGNSEMSRRKRGKRAQHIVRRSLSPLGERIIDSEEQPDLEVSGSSGDDEANYQNLNLDNPELKKQTMADQFQEALAAASLSNEGVHFTASKVSGVGLSRNLQQVMQREKERDADFLKRIQIGPSLNDESHSIVVKILSRYLDAKLIVCRCSFSKNGEVVPITQISWSPALGLKTVVIKLQRDFGRSLSTYHRRILLMGFQLLDSSQTFGDRGREGTVIFNPKVCSNVDLEVGNFICIHPPWKEVQLNCKDENVILSTYFSHI